MTVKERFKTVVRRLRTLSLVMAIGGSSAVSGLLQAEPMTAPNSLEVQQRRAEAMRRALARKIPFSEVTVNRFGNLTDDSDIYEPQLYIRFNDDGVTVQASQVKLERILQDLCWQGGFDLDVRFALPEEASLTMHDAQLSHVLSVLLREYSYVLTSEPNGLVSKLVIMARDETPFRDTLIQEASIAPLVPVMSLSDYMAETDATVRRDLLRSQAGDTSEQAIEFFQSVIDIEPELVVRAQALTLLSAHPSRSVNAVLASMAADPNAALRLEAATHLMARDQTQALQLLGQLAFKDSDAKVRARALVMLDQMPADQTEMIWLSEQAEAESRPVKSPIFGPVPIVAPGNAPATVPISIPR